MNEERINLFKEIYKPSESIISFVLPILIVSITGIITIYYIINVELSLSRLDWNKNKCLPKYMFVSGFIKKEENLGILGSIDKNFKNCVNKINNDYYTLLDIKKKEIK